MNEWQPIETAPTRLPAPNANIQSGIPEIIVGWAGGETIAFAYWEPARAEGGGWDQSGEGWWRAIGGPYGRPTHWMPMPAPPAKVQEPAK